MTAAFLLLCLACASRAIPPPPSYAPADVAWSEMVGLPPPTATLLPAFTATSHDGQTRGPDDLRGKPTALWFYPAANTPG